MVPRCHERQPNGHPVLASESRNVNYGNMEGLQSNQLDVFNPKLRMHLPSIFC